MPPISHVHIGMVSHPFHFTSLRSCSDELGTLGELHKSIFFGDIIPKDLSVPISMRFYTTVLKMVPFKFLEPFFNFKFGIVFTCFLTITQCSGSRCSSGHDERGLFAAENRVLENITYETKMVPHFVLCGRECTMDKDCKSVNYLKNKNMCHLNNSTRVECPQLFLEDEGSVYMDADAETPLFSVTGPLVKSPPRTSSCKKLFEAGYKTSGVYTIYPPTAYAEGLPVYCDMELDGGGWIVLQRRLDGSVDFYQDWAHYQSGFGDLSGEFWLGNEQMVSLTSDDSYGSWDLRVDLTDFDGSTAFAKYGDFRLLGAKYTLSLGVYDSSSTAGDALNYHRNRPFSTKDNDNDSFGGGSCAQHRDGGWWFGYCLNSHLNGEFYLDGSFRHNDGIIWHQWHDSWNPVKTSSMKMRETTM